MAPYDLFVMQEVRLAAASHLDTVRSTRKGCPFREPSTLTLADFAASLTTSVLARPRPTPPCGDAC